MKVLIHNLTIIYLIDTTYAIGDEIQVPNRHIFNIRKASFTFVSG